MEELEDLRKNLEQLSSIRISDDSLEIKAERTSYEAIIFQLKNKVREQEEVMENLCFQIDQMKAVLQEKEQKITQMQEENNGYETN